MALESMLMGSKNCRHIIWVMFFLSSISKFAQSMNNNSYHDPVSLDDFLRGYAYNQVVRLRTGILYKISLPSNFSGMEVSFIRLRTGNFRRHGTNLSNFRIPKGTTFSVPYVKRFDLVFQNLGNLSSVHYNVPNYTLITPVVGFMFYNASNPRTIGNSRLDLIVNGDPILIHFPRISLLENTNVTMQCVRFGANGSVELTKMTLSNACIARNNGHFSIVVPSLPPTRTNRKDRLSKWWVFGFGLGISGFILVAVLGVLTYKLVKRKRIGQMERQSERNEALETTWVGRSKMPSATRIRTQPIIENDYVP